MPRKSRNTKQKEIMQKEIEKFENFFSIEELYEKVKKYKISLATVYRFIVNALNNRKI